MMKNKTDVAVVVVTYNRLELLKQCLSALSQQSDRDFDILLIDNNSTDGTGEYVRNHHHDNVYYFNTGSNLGGAGGFKYGLDLACKKGYKYAWIMDDDTLPQENAFSTLYSGAKILDGKFSFICSLVRWTDGSPCVMNTPVYAAARCFYDTYAAENGLIRIDACSFVSCFVDLDLVRTEGLPIAEFFIYGDDVEFTQRLSKVRPGYLNIHSVVIHACGDNNTPNIASCVDSKIDRYFYDIRNNLYINRKYHKHAHRSNLKLITSQAYYIFRKDNNLKVRRLKTLIRGVFASIAFSPQIQFPNISEGEDSI